ncbi:MAG: tetratricopeptide repeat protein [Bacteroidetes bacterium]|nr:tetratricopeptide repeat protein [Bacteroidota bacterium]
MDRIEMLDSYLDGRLTAEESRRFEALLSRDEDLAKEYQLHQDMAKALLDDKTTEFKKMLDDAHKHHEKRDRRPVFIKMAAAIAIFLTGMRSDGTNQDKLLSKAMELYQNADYLTASRSFEELLKLDPENNQARFYLAISYMENKREPEAVRLLQDIVDTRDVFFLSQSEWYLGICYLLLGRKEEAILPFDRLARKKGYYQEQSKEILEELNKIN